jgi:hypothetical protein
MSTDPVAILAMQRIVAQSAEIEVQLSVKKGCRPVITALLMARDKAADALGELANVDPEDAKAIRGLQNEITIFTDLVSYFAKILSDGFDLDQEITNQDRDMMIDMLSRSVEGQEELDHLGLVQHEASDA